MALFKSYVVINFTLRSSQPYMKYTVRILLESE